MTASVPGSVPETLLDPSRLWEELAREGERIVLLVIDGLGGLPDPVIRRSELEVARTPNLDAVAADSACGLIEPVGPGITPGSGPGHLALFGYHPLRHRIGRGIFSALGIEFPLEIGDVAARMNFSTVDDEGHVTDRRAGRISTEQGTALCKKLTSQVEVEGDADVEWFLEPVREHRAVLVLRGPDLSGDLTDTDPHRTGVAPRLAKGRSDGSEKTERWVRSFVEQCREVLVDETPANSVLLRGFDAHRGLPSLEARFGLRGICLAEYPMYRGLARLLGLEVAPRPEGPEELFGRDLRRAWPDAGDLLFLHYKPADSRGEDGDFEAKVRALEQVDGLLAPLLELEPKVLVVTGDHSTPSRMASHSWHPVPLMIRADTARRDRVDRFDELSCAAGSLGLRPGLDVMGLAMAHAGRLRKFGA